MKRNIILGLALLMTLSLLFACGTTTPSQTTAGSTTQQQTTEALTTQADATTTAANQAETTNEATEQIAEGLEEVVITWVVPGNYPMADQDEVFAEFNRLVKEQINTTVDFLALGWGDFETKISVMIGSGDYYDLTYTCDWVNFFPSNAAKGAYYDITELLPQYAPKTYAKFPETYWEAVKIKNRIYAVINEQVAVRTAYLVIPEENLEETGYDIDKDFIKGDLRSLEPFLDKYFENDPSRLNNHYFFGAFGPVDYEYIAGGNIPVGINCMTGDTTVVNIVELPEFVERYSIAAEWKDKGYMNPTLRITQPILGPAEDYLSGRIMGMIGGQYMPGCDVQEAPKYGRPVRAVPFYEPFLTTGSATATCTAVSITSKNPDRALMLLELLNNMPEGQMHNKIYDTLSFGIEGKHWNYDNDGLLERTEAGEERYFLNTEWMWASRFQSTPLTGSSPTVWDECREFNKISITSPLMGFVFDAEPVEAETAAVSAVNSEYSAALGVGMFDMKVYEEIKEKYKVAGIDTIIAEAQKQIDEWKASR